MAATRGCFDARSGTSAIAEPLVNSYMH